MKKLLFILLLPVFVHAQHLATNRWVMGPGEYVNEMVDITTHRLYLLVDRPSTFSGLPDSFVSVAGGAHHFMALTLGGRIAGWGANGDGNLGIHNNTDQGFPQFSSTDSLGNTLPRFKKVMCGGTIGWNSWAVSFDGRLYGCGDMSLGMRGNNTFGGKSNAWVQIPFPAGVILQDAICSAMGIALDTAGNVYTWGSEGTFGGFGPPYFLCQGTATPNTRNPTKVHLPTGVRGVQIMGGTGIPSYILGSDGRVYAWSYNVQYIGIRGSRDMSFVGFNPWDVTDSLGFTTGQVDSIVCNSMFSIALLKDSTLQGWGSNACSDLGNGPGIDMRHYRTPSNVLAPYNWSQGLGEAMVIKPQPIMLGKHNFTKVFASNSICFWFNAEDVHDSLYGAGRNKGGVMGNMIGGVDTIAQDLIAAYPNSWDVVRWTCIFPFRPSFVTRTTTPLFIDTTGAPLQSTYPVNTSGLAPTCSAGSTQNISLSYTTLFGSWGVTSPGKGLYSRVWICTSKPPGAPNPYIPLAANDTIPISNLTATGAYVFSYAVTDNNFKTSTSSVTINVGSLPPPPPSPQYFYKRRGRRYLYIGTSAYIGPLKHNTNETDFNHHSNSLHRLYRPRTDETGKEGYSSKQSICEVLRPGDKGDDVLHRSDDGRNNGATAIYFEPGFLYETRRRGLLENYPGPKNPGC